MNSTYKLYTRDLAASTTLQMNKVLERTIRKHLKKQSLSVLCLPFKITQVLDKCFKIYEHFNYILKLQ